MLTDVVVGGELAVVGPEIRIDSGPMSNTAHVPG